jgi:orotate phosphoribosyltransferase
MSWEFEKEKLGEELTHMLYDSGMIQTWFRDKPEGWVLKSGIWSPFFIQLRLITSLRNSRQILGKVGYAMGRMIQEEIPSANKTLGIAVAGIPLATAITMTCGFPHLYNRKLEGVRTVEDFQQTIETYGAHSMVEGEILPVDNIVLVDDLTTSFESKEIAHAQLMYEIERRGVEGVTCDNVAVLFDREQGAKERAEELGMGMYSLIPFASGGLRWLGNKMAADEHHQIWMYLQNPKPYQNPEKQQYLRKIAQRPMFPW